MYYYNNTHTHTHKGGTRELFSFPVSWFSWIAAPLTKLQNSRFKNPEIDQSIIASERAHTHTHPFHMASRTYIVASQDWKPAQLPEMRLFGPP
jgi:hypothetical protein